MTDAPQWKMEWEDKELGVHHYVLQGIEMHNSETYVFLPSSLLAQIEKAAYNKGYSDGCDWQMEMRLRDHKEAKR